MRVLVTGGAGFIGSHYVRTAIDGGYPDLADASIVVLDKLTYAGNLANLREVESDDRFEFVRGDIADAPLVDSLLRDVDHVVHFAAESHVDRSIEEGAEFVRTNVTGTQTLLEAAKRHSVSRFVHVSTDEVYGSIASGSWDEEQPLDPTSPYSASKAGSDLIALAYARTFRLPVMVTRCSNNYGPYQFPEKVIPLFVTNLLTGGTVPLYGDGHNVRDWIHVADHCRAVEAVRAGGRPGEIYNVAGEAELSNRELTRRLLRACGCGWEQVRLVADRLAHDRRYSVDATKIKVELGFVPSVDIDEGLRATVAWFRENRQWWEPLRDPASLGPKADNAEQPAIHA